MTLQIALLFENFNFGV